MDTNILQMPVQVNLANELLPLLPPDGYHRLKDNGVPSSLLLTNLGESNFLMGASVWYVGKELILRNLIRQELRTL